MSLAKATSAVDALQWAVERLGGGEDARREAEVLLRHVLNVTRASLFAQHDRTLETDETKEFEELVERRTAKEPLQYLTGTQAFRSLELRVGPGVLIPRPETEVVVERSLDLISEIEQPLVADIGVGSGAMALSIATERSDAVVWGTDASPSAIEWASKNRRKARAANLHLREGDLFDALPDSLKAKFDLVVTNPPYLSAAELAASPFEVREHEPSTSTLAGPTGLEIASRIAADAIEWLKPGGWLVMETHPDQAGRLKTLLDASYAPVGLRPDLSGKIRIAEGRKPQSR